MIALALVAAILNPLVHQDTIGKTICVPGFAKHYRQTHPVRMKSRKGYIRDHIVPLEIGGSSDPANIQWQSVAEAHRKDLDERRLNRAVCSGKMDLRSAQMRMEAWR